MRRHEYGIINVSEVNDTEKIPMNGVVAIASSTGGPKALQSVIPRLPADFPVPVLIVQHMQAGFTKSLAERLNTLSALTVKEAEEGEALKKGYVYLAKTGMHIIVSPLKRSHGKLIGYNHRGNH